MTEPETTERVRTAEIWLTRPIADDTYVECRPERTRGRYDGDDLAPRHRRRRDRQSVHRVSDIVSRHDVERPAVQLTHWYEVAMIKGQNVADTIPGAEDDERGVGQAGL